MTPAKARDKTNVIEISSSLIIWTIQLVLFNLVVNEIDSFTHNFDCKELQTYVRLFVKLNTVVLLINGEVIVSGGKAAEKFQ